MNHSTMNSPSLFNLPCLQDAANDPLTFQGLDDKKNAHLFRKINQAMFYDRQCCWTKQPTNCDKGTETGGCLKGLKQLIMMCVAEHPN